MLKQSLLGWRAVSYHLIQNLVDSVGFQAFPPPPIIVILCNLSNHLVARTRSPHSAPVPLHTNYPSCFLKLEIIEADVSLFSQESGLIDIIQSIDGIALIILQVISEFSYLDTIRGFDEGDFFHNSI